MLEHFPIPHLSQSKNLQYVHMAPFLRTGRMNLHNMEADSPVHPCVDRKVLADLPSD